MTTKKTTKREYSKDDRAAALTLLDFNRGNVNGTAKQLKIPEATLRLWDRERQTNQEKKAEVEVYQGDLKEKFESVIHAALEAGQKKLPGASLTEINSFIAMMTDKYQVLGNKPSAITGIAADNRFHLLAEILAPALQQHQQTGSPEIKQIAALPASDETTL